MPGLESILVEFGLMLRDARPDEGTDEPGDPGPGRRIGEDHAQGARRDGGTDDGNHARQDTEASQGTQPQAAQGPGQRTRSGVRIMFAACGIRPIFGVSHGDADMVFVETSVMKLGDGLVGVETILEHADYGRTLLSFHGGLIKQISDRRMGNTVSKSKFKLNS